MGFIQIFWKIPIVLIILLLSILFRRKSQRTRPRDDGHKNHKSEKVVPYTLPPLPTFDDERIETTTESMMHKEEKKQSKNPWHKSKQPKDEIVKYGEKLSGKI